MNYGVNITSSLLPHFLHNQQMRKDVTHRVVLSPLPHPPSLPPPSFHRSLPLSLSLSPFLSLSLPPSLPPSLFLTGCNSCPSLSLEGYPATAFSSLRDRESDDPVSSTLPVREGRREGGREGGKKGEREGGREGGRREGGREGGKGERKNGERERGREGGRKEGRGDVML